MIASVIMIITVFVSYHYIPYANTDNTENYTLTPEDLIVTIFDVGHGDTIFVHHNDSDMLIDCGGYYPDLKIRDYVIRNNIKDLDYVIITHDHMDHTSALTDVMTMTKVNKLITNDDIKRNDKIQFGDIDIIVLNPPEKEYYSNENDNSIVLMMEYDGIKLLLEGDAEHVAERNMINSELDLDCDILKVAHHGSDTSTSEEFIKASTPSISIVSTQDDINTSFDDSVRKTLEDIGSRVYTTPEYGDIVVTVNDGEYTIVTEK